MVVLFLVLQFILVEELYSSGVGQIKFLRYEDNSGCGGLISDLCDFYFKPLKIQDGNGNILKNIARTDTTDNTANVDLTKVSQLSSPIQINVPTNRTVKIVTTVWDVCWPSSDDKIRQVTDFMVPFSTVSVGDNWKQAIKTSSNPDMKFTVQYKLTQCEGHFTGPGCNFCESSYFTKLCNKYCAPVVGQYNCTDQGTKVCLGNWNGTDCDSCITHYYGASCSKFCNETANYTCDNAGDKNCKDNFYPNQQCDVFCKPETGKFNCSDQGDKVCFANWKGTDCDECALNYYPNGTCDVLCESLVGQYNCTDQGTKVCQGNWKGTDCDTCSLNYFGADCSKFCNETASYTCDYEGDKNCKENFYPNQRCDTFCNSSSVSYTCNKTGDKDCREDYYPAKQCDKFCRAEPGNYTCNNATGEKNCYGKKAGDNCEHCIDDYYPEGECSHVLCEPEEGYYTCSDDGEKVCLKNRASPDCTSCIENYYGRTCTKFCKLTTNYNCSENGDKICVDISTSVANNCREGTQQIGVWVGSSVVAFLLIILILGAFCILQSCRKQENISAGNVVYVNTAVPDHTAKNTPTAKNNYDNVVLHVTLEDAHYIDNTITIDGKFEDATYIDNTIVPDEATYTYARAEDMARIKI